MSGYPDPDTLDLPDVGQPSPDQEFYLGWLVQHNRLWLVVVAELLVIAGLVAALFVQSSRFQPSIQYVTLPNGLPTVWNDKGNMVLAGTEYYPARLRAVVNSFIQNRYAWNWRDPEKINQVRPLMSEAAWTDELRKIAAINPRTTIVADQVQVEVTPDLEKWEVVAETGGRFRVNIEAQVRINDVRYPDPNRPLIRAFTVSLLVQTVPATDQNPLGYQIIETGRALFATP